MWMEMGAVRSPVFHRSPDQHSSQRIAPPSKALMQAFQGPRRTAYLLAEKHHPAIFSTTFRKRNTRTKVIPGERNHKNCATVTSRTISEERFKTFLGSKSPGRRENESKASQDNQRRGSERNQSKTLNLEKGGKPAGAHKTSCKKM